MAPLCAMDSVMSEMAASANVWDRLLFEEATELDALDEAFFARSDVADALAAHGGAAEGEPAHVAGPNGAARSPSKLLAQSAPGSIGASLAVSTPMIHQVRTAKDSPASCGLLRDETLPPAEPRRRSPLCWRKQLLYHCCWTLPHAPLPHPLPHPLPDPLLQAPETWPRPVPPLPLPVRCILPPAGAKSGLKVVHVPTLAARFDQASCVLACASAAAPWSYAGIESSGALCFCLSVADLRLTDPLHHSECTLPCSGRFRIMRAPNDIQALPCGGTEAVAVYHVPSVIAALASAASASPAAQSAQPASSDLMQRPVPAMGAFWLHSKKLTSFGSNQPRRAIPASLRSPHPSDPRIPQIPASLRPPHPSDPPHP